jgi:hypothetical protein
MGGRWDMVREFGMGDTHIGQAESRQGNADQILHGEQALEHLGFHPARVKCCL